MSNAKFIAIFIAAILVLLPGLAHAQAPFRGMKLLTQNTGWAAQGRQLYWTNDFGQDWREITPPGVAPHGPAEMADVFFLNTSDGWVLLRRYTPGGPYGDWSFEVASTDDSGITWSIAPVSIPDWDPKSYSLGGSGLLDFADAAHGWLSLSIQTNPNFSSGVLLTTADGGSTWKLAPPAPVGFGVIRFTSSQTGWIAGGPGGSELVVTRDGGKTWQQVRLTPPGGIPLGSMPVYRPPVSTGPRQAILVACFGWAAVFYESGDGGRTWRPALVLKGRPGSIGSVLPMAIAGSTVILPARKRGGHLHLSAFSLTGSAQLITGALPAQFLLQSASFISPGRGWVLSFGGLPLYGTSDGGATWTDITPGPHMPRISRHAAK